MSEKRSKNTEVEEKLNDITECSICAETFKEPVILSCIHTFCKNCLQEFATTLGKSIGDSVACPICRKEFSIPEEGFDGLQKNFFMDRLIEMKSILKTPSDRRVCEVCLDQAPSSGDESESSLHVAEVFCSDCQQMLCNECHRHHLKSKLSKAHRILYIGERQEITETSLEKSVPEFCDIHKNQPLGIYCLDCLDAVCAICFVKDHESHKVSAVELVVNDFRNQLQDYIDGLVDLIPVLQQKKVKLKDDEVDFTENLSKLDIEINERVDKVRAFVEVQSASLTSEISMHRKAGLKYLSICKDDIDTLMVSLDSFRIYCQQIMISGSAENICKSFGSLRNRAAELKKLSEVQTDSFQFRRLQLKRRLGSTEENIVGELKDYKTETENVENTTTEINPEAEERKEAENLKDRQRKSDAIERNLKKKIKELKQQVILLRGIALGEISPNESTGAVDYKTEFKFQKNVAIFSTSNHSSWTISGLAILDNELFVIVKQQSLCTQVYSLNTFKFNRRWAHKKLAKVNDKVNDFKACKSNKCLYFMMLSFSKQATPVTETNEIIRFDPNGTIINAWLVEDSIGQLSISDEGTVLFTVWNKDQLQEYTPEGQLIHVISLSWNNGFSNVWHAVKLNSSYYLVSHGKEGDSFRRICLVDSDGKVLHYVDNNECWACFKRPVHMEKDGNNIIVTDTHLNQLFAYSCHLELHSYRPIYNTERGRSLLFTIVDGSNGRIIVVERSKSSDYDWTVVLCPVKKSPA